MKVVGIDARFYGEAGPGRYVKNIITHLEQVDSTNKYFIFLRKRGYDLYVPKNPNFVKVLADFSWYSFEEQVFFLLKLLVYKLDLLYVPHFNIPIFYPGKIVTAIADIIMHSFSTEEGTTLPRPYYRFKKFIYYMVVLIALLRSKRVIVPSNDTKNDLLHHYPFVSKNKYVLAYEGLDPDLTHFNDNAEGVMAKYKIKRPFLLYVSSMYKHKNVERLIEAFKLLKSNYGFNGQLVLVGKNDSFAKKIWDLINYFGMAEQILMPGLSKHVSDDDVTVLRHSASAYVFPSLKEGFSLTPLEAMEASLPCAISKIPCHEEVFGDSALLFDPFDAKDMAAKINTLINNVELRKTLISRGLKRVKDYSWFNTASITFNVFESVLNNR